MLGVQPLLDYAKSKIKLSLVFEVVDDPDDQSDYRTYLKPVDVWFVFSRDSRDIPFDPNDYRSLAAAEVMFYPGLTKQTARDIRQWASLDTAFDQHYLYVLAEPQKEWAHLYGTRQYKLRVGVGRTYNIAVSLPPLMGPSASLQEAKEDRQRQAMPGKFRL